MSVVVNIAILSLFVAYAYGQDLTCTFGMNSSIPNDNVTLTTCSASQATGKCLRIDGNGTIGNKTESFTFRGCANETLCQSNYCKEIVNQYDALVQVSVTNCQYACCMTSKCNDQTIEEIRRNKLTTTTTMTTTTTSGSVEEIVKMKTSTLTLATIMSALLSRIIL